MKNIFLRIENLANNFISIDPTLHFEPRPIPPPKPPPTPGQDYVDKHFNCNWNGVSIIVFGNMGGTLANLLRSDRNNRAYIPTAKNRVSIHTRSSVLDEIKKLEGMAESMFFDQTGGKAPEEKDRGITIAVEHVENETDKRQCTHVNYPVYTDYIEDTITGTAQTDGAVPGVLVVAGGIEPWSAELLSIGDLVNKLEESIKLAGLKQRKPNRAAPAGNKPIVRDSENASCLFGLIGILNESIPVLSSIRPSWDVEMVGIRRRFTIRKDSQTVGEALVVSDIIGGLGSQPLKVHMVVRRALNLGSGVRFPSGLTQNNNRRRQLPQMLYLRDIRPYMPGTVQN